jgi:transcriptional regulator with XRE-family HTH domain
MALHPVDIHVGKKLRLRRTMLGMSQEAIGSAIGVTFQQIQKYERGINRMGASRLFDFARVLSIPVEYFFEGLEGAEGKTAFGVAESNAPAFEHEKMTDRETLELVRTYYRIKEAPLRKRVLDLMKSIADNQAIV